MKPTTSHPQQPALPDRNQPISGIHHVTALAGDPSRNVDFYRRVLGLRLVKKTVNFDDPGTYHLYYGDETGRPGTILTFFPWPGARRGERGVGQATVTRFAVPEGTIGSWQQRLVDRAGSVEVPQERFGERSIRFADPDGLRLELVETAGAGDVPGWTGSPVGAEMAIRGFSGVSLRLRRSAPTAALLSGLMGFREVARDGAVQRLVSGSGSSREMAAVSSPSTGFVPSTIDLVEDPSGTPGRIAAGTVHHVAFRVADGDEQIAWQQALADEGLGVTEVKDRQYFQSIYFREPGGVLFELATDSPGFTLDETTEELGNGLMLPPWFEQHRERIEASLPSLSTPDAAS